MDTPVRIGVIGAGWFASRRHLPDIQRNEHAALSALCRRDGEALKRLADHFAPETTFTDWREMLDRAELDAVLIATPHNLHYEPAKAALERGLHVLVEKPMTVHASEARELAQTAKERGLVLTTALNPPFWAHCHRIHAAIHAGRIGEVEAIDYFWTGNADMVFGRAPIPADLPGLVPPTLYRANADQCGGGYFIDGGSHLASDLLWSTGLRVTDVSCMMDSLPTDSRALVSLRLGNGAAACINSVGNSRCKDRRVRNVIAGSEGTITVEGFEFRTTVHHAGGEPETFTESDLHPVSGPVTNFVDAILGYAELLSPAEHGVHVVEVVEAAYRSAETGSVIHLDTGLS
jgi:predicted dehydrogenase